MGPGAYWKPDQRRKIQDKVQSSQVRFIHQDSKGQTDKKSATYVFVSKVQRSCSQLLKERVKKNRMDFDQSPTARLAKKINLTFSKPKNPLSRSNKLIKVPVFIRGNGTQSLPKFEPPFNMGRASS